ncbi:MAG: circadian clock protein KaiB [Pleurocapsa sp. SU_5_0]|nr:circadian clock protein KaiB [Pleurocapsa sp. SU_5_0]NJR44356.1 circadian clock protein KaiB [Hyellaceae cyanobacterium CSU_1_1]
MINVLPQVFKGIALFTPGGDLIYGIDPSKKNQWHAHLCHGLQKILNLAESPHFLVPQYTATVERWLDPSTHQLKTIAEIYPAVQQYIPLLQVLFELDPKTEWQIAPWQENYCHRAVIETYKPHFPQLWQRQDLVVRLDPQQSAKLTDEDSKTFEHQIKLANSPQIEGYNLRLFISSAHDRAEKTLSNLHQLLEERLTNPYSLKVIDVAKNPEQAVIHQVLTTPTLIRVSPEPIKRIVGQLDDISRVLKIISS